MTKKFLRVLAALSLPACTLAMAACNGVSDDSSSSEKSQSSASLAPSTSSNVASSEPTPVQSSENVDSSETPVTPSSSEATSSSDGPTTSDSSESAPVESSEEPTSSEPAHEHVFNQEVATEAYLASPATCTEKARYYYSCECGEKGTETFEYGEALGHSFASDWTYDETNHWHAATCEHTDEKKDVAPHTFTVAEDGLSKSCECGYKVDCIVDVDVLLEAEDAVLNPAHISIDENAHGGKYALGFNDCGQGMYFRYFAYEDGERNVDVVYATGYDAAYMTMFVNNEAGVKVSFSEKTGWFGDSHVSATATVTATFKKGWNEIYLIKNGTEADNWGQYAQIDYIKIKGTGKDFTGQEFDRMVNSYKLEAEMAAWHWSNTSTRPSRWGDKFSLEFGLGEMNAVGDGVKFVIKADYTGTYKVRLAYGADNNGVRDIAVYINGTLVNEGKNLENGTTGWNDIKLDNSGITLDMVKGETYTIDFQRGSVWYVPDYLLLELVK